MFVSIVTLLDNEYSFLYYYPGKKIIHHKIKKWAPEMQFRELLDRGYEHMKSVRATKWLSDDRGNSVVKPEDEEWVQNNWLPRVIAAGWKYWAFIPPEKIIGKINMERHREIMKNSGVEVRAFANPQEALEWLESVR
ncbi:MAG: hypothetical protein R3C03_12190 [Pirellulaceae bacterium]